MANRMAYVGCDGIVIQDGRILMQRREDFNTWGPPGGGLESGEYLLDGVRREVWEETGIRVEPQELIAIHWRRWLGRDIVVFSFRCRPIGGEPRPGPEALEVRTFPLDELPTPIHPLQRQRLEEVLSTDGCFQTYVQRSSLSAQFRHGVKLAWRSLRNRVQRRPAWHPKGYNLSAFATIWDGDGRVLLFHQRDKNAWKLPGGWLKGGDPPWDACPRAVREETGIKVQVTGLTGVYAQPRQDKIVFNFNCSVAGGRLRSSDETGQARYFHPDTLPETLLTPQRQWVMDAADGVAACRPHPVIRDQSAA